MFDSVGKPGTSLASANLNWVGSYKQCKRVSVPPPVDINGRYCRTTIGLPEGLSKDVSF